MTLSLFRTFNPEEPPLKNSKERKARIALHNQALIDDAATALALKTSNEQTTYDQIAEIEKYIISLEDGTSIRCPHTTDLENQGKNLFHDAMVLFTTHSSSLIESVSPQIHNAHHEAILSLTTILHFVEEVQNFLSSGLSVMATPSGDVLTIGSTDIPKKTRGGQKGKRVFSDEQPNGISKRQKKGNIFQRTVSYFYLEITRSI